MDNESLTQRPRTADEVVLLTSMLESYRTLGQETSTALASTTGQLRRVNEMNLRLRAELRRYTASMVLGQAA